MPTSSTAKSTVHRISSAASLLTLPLLFSFTDKAKSVSSPVAVSNPPTTVVMTAFNSPSISYLTSGERTGLVLAAEASSERNTRWDKKTFSNNNWKLFQGPVGICMFSLFAFSLLQTIGGTLDVRWAHNGIVTAGPYCRARGLVEQTGDLGVALITVFLAVHTFVAAVLPAGLKARGVALCLARLACVFIMLWVAIDTVNHKNYETPPPYWCWISPQFPGENHVGSGGPPRFSYLSSGDSRGLVVSYIWLWIAIIAPAILYIPLYFWAGGPWSIDGEYRFHWRNPDHGVEYTQGQASLGILLYPIAYSLLILPLSIARWLHAGQTSRSASNRGT